MKPFFIGIAGGSGTGKTAIVKEFKKQFKSSILLLHLDNYQRYGQKLPNYRGMKNWDHPRTIRWDRLLLDLQALRVGKEVKTKVRDQKNLKVIHVISFRPTKIIIIEGYLLFHNPSVRKALDYLIYLEAKDETRAERRTKIKGKDNIYIHKVVNPMHNKYIVPTKRFADVVIDTDKNTIKQAVKKIKIGLSRNQQFAYLNR